MKPIVMRRINERQLNAAIQENMKRGFVLEKKWKQPRLMDRGFVVNWTYVAVMRKVSNNEMVKV